MGSFWRIDMNTLYVKLCGLSFFVLPLMELHIMDYLRSAEFRMYIAQSVITPLLTGLSNAAIQVIFSRVFGVI